MPARGVQALSRAQEGEKEDLSSSCREGGVDDRGTTHHKYLFITTATTLDRSKSTICCNIGFGHDPVPRVLRKPTRRPAPKAGRFFWRAPGAHVHPNLWCVLQPVPRQHQVREAPSILWSILLTSDFSLFTSHFSFCARNSSFRRSSTLSSQRLQCGAWFDSSQARRA